MCTLDWISYWREGKRFRTSSYDVIDHETGCPCLTPDHSASVLASVWAPKFTELDISLNAAAAFIQPHVLDMSGLEFDITREQFVNFVKRHKMSSPGPDGIHYVFWVTEQGIEILWQIRLAMNRGATPPATFNDALLVLIRKSSAEGLARGRAIEPKDARPLSMGNTDAKHGYGFSNSFGPGCAQDDHHYSRRFCQRS